MSLSEFRKLAGIANPNERAAWKLEAAPTAVKGLDDGPFLANLREAALRNSEFRRVVYTGEKTQFTLMHIPPGGDIGEETHPSVEQIFFCVSGSGTTSLDGIRLALGEGTVLVVPAGTKHNIENTGIGPLKFFTSYSPPNHLPTVSHQTKADADADVADEKFGRKVATQKESRNSKVSLDEVAKTEQMVIRLKAHVETVGGITHTLAQQIGSPMEFYAATGDLVAAVGRMLGKGSGDRDLMDALAEVAAALNKRSIDSRDSNGWAAVASD